MRRRRTRGTWLPTVGTDNGDVEGFNFAGRQFGFFLNTNGNPSVIIVPVIHDPPIEGEQAVTIGLNDFIGNEYLLQRIVGKCIFNRFATLQENISSFIDTQPAVILSCGFFVARAQDFDTGDLNQPIGSNSAAERNDNYNPLDIDCIREPWIWRRTWLLGSKGVQITPTVNTTFAGSAGGATLLAGYYPPSTVDYGSIQDGPHIDSKVKRRVRQDERLWFVVCASGFPFGTTSGENMLGVTGFLDLRVFGSLRKARNSSSF